MQNQKFLVSFAAIALLSLRAAAAQHTGHQMPAGSPAGEAADACVEHSRQGLQIIESANRLLEESRQSNNPTRMRTAMDELQGALGQLRTHLSLCVSAMPAAQKEGEQTDHSKMGHDKPSTQSTAPAKDAVDPVCGMKVNPKTDLRAEYAGKTYYFCSESDREKFLKDPKSFVGKRG